MLVRNRFSVHYRTVPPDQHSEFTCVPDESLSRNLAEIVSGKVRFVAHLRPAPPVSPRAVVVRRMRKVGSERASKRNKLNPAWDKDLYKDSIKGLNEYEKVTARANGRRNAL
eukprot:1122183-Prymnesium_polylepis.1